MDRRDFLRSSLAASAALPILARDASGDQVQRLGFSRRRTDPRALIMDAMGELRTIYEPPLVKQMLASGMDSITITLTLY